MPLAFPLLTLAVTLTRYDLHPREVSSILAGLVCGQIEREPGDLPGWKACQRIFQQYIAISLRDSELDPEVEALWWLQCLG